MGKGRKLAFCASMICHPLSWTLYLCSAIESLNKYVGYTAFSSFYWQRLWMREDKKNGSWCLSPGVHPTQPCCSLSEVGDREQLRVATVFLRVSGQATCPKGFFHWCNVGVWNFTVPLPSLVPTFITWNMIIWKKRGTNPVHNRKGERTRVGSWK